MVKTLEQIESALSQEVNKGTIEATIKTTPDGFDYIEWHESNRIANKVFGFTGWSSEVVSVARETIDIEVMVNDLDENGKPIWVPGPNGKNIPQKHSEMRTFHGFMAIVRILVHVRDEVSGQIHTFGHDGIGFGPVTQQGGSKNPMDTASKAAKSDGLSTAFKHFGDAFGLFLYTKATPAVNVGQGGTSNQGSSQASGSQDLGFRPSAGQLKGLYAIGLNDGQIATLPFKTWKAMLDDLWNKDQSKKLAPEQILVKYKIERNQAPTQESNYPWKQPA